MQLAQIQCQNYETAEPFAWTSLDGLEFLDAETLDLARAEIAARIRDEPDYIYDNPLERKGVINSGNMPRMAAITERLHSEEWIEFVEQMTRISGLAYDGSMYGAGLSIVPPGGYLALHRDLQIHPTTGHERRVNLALFLNREWDDDWGGHLEFWSECGGKPKACIKRLRPKFGRIVLFDPNGFHGFPDPIRCPEGVSRLSLQLFYYSQPRAVAHVTARQRAWFELRPGEDPSKVINDFRVACRK